MGQSLFGLEIKYQWLKMQKSVDCTPPFPRYRNIPPNPFHRSFPYSFSSEFPLHSFFPTPPTPFHFPTPPTHFHRSFPYSFSSVFPLLFFPYSYFPCSFQSEFCSVWWSCVVASFCQWNIEHQVRQYCVKGLILTNVAGCVRDAGRLYKSGYKKERCQPKIWGYSV